MMLRKASIDHIWAGDEHVAVINNCGVLRLIVGHGGIVIFRSLADSVGFTLSYGLRDIVAQSCILRLR